MRVEQVGLMQVPEFLGMVEQLYKLRPTVVEAEGDIMEVKKPKFELAYSAFLNSFSFSFRWWWI
jgi:hypothetical protein